MYPIPIITIPVTGITKLHFIRPKDNIIVCMYGFATKYDITKKKTTEIIIAGMKLNAV